MIIERRYLRRMFEAEVIKMDAARKIRVFVVDDHPLMVAGIAGEINAQPDMTVVAQATDGEDALALYREHRPDVTLMDVRMPKVNGIDAMAAIRKEFPKARIIVLTTAIGDIQALRAFKEGAVGYLLKNLVRKELTDTIRAIHAGMRRIPPDVAQQLAEHAADDAITARELDVLRMVAQGKANKTIASDLKIAEHTVKNHMKNILSKLGADDRTGAVVIAARRGYIEI
jgi:DNA-binding NarL/FixJ family response regulator